MSAIPTYVADPSQHAVLKRLETDLNEAHDLGLSWQLRAAMIAGAATVLEALGQATSC